MKIMWKLLVCMTTLCGVSGHITAANATGNVDGFTSPVIVDKWIPGATGDGARGFVRIKDGIYLGSGNVNGIGVSAPVGNVIDLNNAQLDLEEDLVLSGTSFGTSSGTISTTLGGQTFFSKRIKLLLIRR